MKTLRSVAAVVAGYVLVVLITEFGFRLFPGGRAPKDGEPLPILVATLVAVAAGFCGGYVAAALATWRPVVTASAVAAPLVIESIWLLTTRTPASEFWLDFTGACTLIGSTLLGGYVREMKLRHFTGNGASSVGSPLA